MKILIGSIFYVHKNNVAFLMTLFKELTWQYDMDMTRVCSSGNVRVKVRGSFIKEYSFYDHIYSLWEYVTSALISHREM